MDKQSTIGLILIGLVLVVWLYFNSPKPNPQTINNTDTTFVENNTRKNIKKNEDSLNKENLSEKNLNGNNFAEEDSSIVFSNAEEKIITVETDLVKVLLTNKGGKIHRLYLKNYQTWYNDEDEILNKIGGKTFENLHVQLLNQMEKGDFNIRFVTKDGKLINTAYKDFKTDSLENYYRIKENDSISISYTYEFGTEKTLTKNFIFYANNYASKVEIEMKNLHDVIGSYMYNLEWATGINFVEENSVNEATFSSASAYTGGEQVVVEASSHDETEKKEFNGKIDWVGIRNMYFSIIIAPLQSIDEGGAIIEGINKPDKKWGERKYFSTSLKIPFNKTNYQKNSFSLFIGPLDYSILESYDRNYEQIYDFGSFFGLKFITRPISEYMLLPLFKFLHLFIPNYGFVIIIFSLIIKFALSPFTKQSFKSMRKMQKLKPKIDELKEKYKNDQQKIQKETMKLYSTYGVNPMGGCLPMLLQMPILFALFTFFKVTIEIRHEPFVWWITNLSSPDIIYTLPFKIPFIGVDQISGLALLLGATMFLNQKMTVTDPSQKAMVYVMPVMFTFMFMGFPSGLNLYYLMFNIFSILQQLYIVKKSDDEELKPVKNPKKKGGFMQRMMEAAEQKQREQQQAMKKNKKKKF